MRKSLFCCALLSALISITTIASAQVTYPHSVKYIRLKTDGQAAKMAYMDAPAAKPNGKTVVLLHGKNFNGFYWKDVIRFLNRDGYRVVVPDQLGFGRSDKPDIHYSFHLLADNTAALLDSLGVKQTSIIAHSMGGMLAVRFALMYPDRVDKLILENPIGLEDYRSFVPYQSFDSLYKSELGATYESYKKYQQSYYPEWKPEYEALVKAQAESLDKPDFKATAKANALTYLMIYEQPVVYELSNIKALTMVVIGQQDRTIVGKAKVPKALQEFHGQYPQLGKETAKAIDGSTLIEIQSAGHIPHIQLPLVFEKAVVDFL